MRRLTTAAAAVMFASTLLANGHTCEPGKARVFADDDIVWANNLSGARLDALKAKYGKVFLFSERGEKAYVVTDSDTLDRVRHIVQPQTQLGREQARLGTQQAALGTKQASLGLEQSRLGIRQLAAPESEKTSLVQRQNELARRQEALSRQQEALSKEQQTLSEKQESLQKDCDAQIDTVLDQAIRQGLAKQVN